ncbi:putative signal protein with GAF, PAS(PAC) and GGDEF domains [Mizugakiibacter sediminis]|uniref:Diguanylate cyclase n=1 Tax=Mizugakiibacter sediminis TaxID=1475481 RepID=A0A0K8QRL9_9GAMM|nr:PAS domain S-box protein [Mizugakiibacter sediminis]GAP67545.1 putative signal protein with GAF, PAS(PAC) and GGDEF domains [Mizugakiibacter sediminis]
MEQTAAWRDASLLARQSRWLLVLGFIAAAAVPVGIATVGVLVVDAQFRAQAGAVRLSLARKAAADVDFAVSVAQARLRTMAARFAGDARLRGDRAALIAELALVQQNAVNLRSLAVTGADGAVVAAYPEGSPASALAARADAAARLAVAPDGEMQILMRIPIRAADGSELGAVIGAAPLARVFATLRTMPFAVTDAISVLARDGRTLASSVAARNGKPGVAGALYEALRQGREEVGEYRSAIDGRQEFGALAQAQSVPVALLVSQSSAEGFGVLRTIRGVQVFATGSLLLLGLGLLALSLRAHHAFQQRMHDAGAMLHAVIEGTTDVILVHDREGRVLLANSAGLAFTGRSREEVVGHPSAEWLDAATAEAMAARRREVIERGCAIATEEVFRVGKELREYSVVRVPIDDTRGHVHGVLSVLRDITDTKRALRALRRSERRFRDLFEQSPSFIWTHDAGGRLLAANPAIAQALGSSVEALIGRNLVEFIPQAERQAFVDYLRTVARQGNASGTFCVRHADGTLHTWHYANRWYEQDEGTPYVLGYAQDITEREDYERQLIELSRLDPLTRCWNRRYLEEFEARAGPHGRWGCVVVDLDHFKSINDTYGHKQGDATLVAMGRFLADVGRSGDAVVRLGGDEFALIVDGASEADLAGLVARIEREAAAQTQLAFSYGWALHQDGEPLERTIARADEHLYQRRRAQRAGLPAGDSGHGRAEAS